jgi:hypothetical protein
LGFKDTVRRDAAGVFFNENEFAGRNSGDPHTWDGEEIPAVLDSNVVRTSNSTEYPAFPSGTLTVYVPVGAIPRPKEGTPHRFDGALFTVWDVREDMGVYVITLIAGSP